MAVSGQCLLLEDSASFSSLKSPAEEGFPACRVDPVTHWHTCRVVAFRALFWQLSGLCGRASRPSIPFCYPGSWKLALSVKLVPFCEFWRQEKWRGNRFWEEFFYFPALSENLKPWTWNFFKKSHFIFCLFCSALLWVAGRALFFFFSVRNWRVDSTIKLYKIRKVA